MNTDSKVTTIDDELAPAAAPIKKTVVRASKAPTGQPELDGDKVTITIHQSTEFDGRDAVPVGHNERVYQIPRGVPSVVPKAVAQIIIDAVVDRVDSVGGKTVITQAPRFAYTITPA